MLAEERRKCSEKISFMKTQTRKCICVVATCFSMLFQFKVLSRRVFPLSATFPLSSCLSRFFLTGHEDLTKNHRQEPKLNFLIKAIYTLAYGLQTYHEDVCGKDFIGACPQLSKSFNHSRFFVSQFFNHLKANNSMNSIFFISH